MGTHETGMVCGWRRGACAAIALLCAGSAHAEELHERVARANGLMAEGKAAEAAGIFAEDLAALGEKAPVRLWYDAGSALLAAGELEKAEAPLRVALSRSEDASVRGAAAFNLGVLEAGRAEQQAKTGAEGALDTLRKSERYFRAAAQEGVEGAARNVDLVQRRMAALQEQQKQEQQKKQYEQKSDKSKKQDSKSDQSKAGGKDGEQSPQSDQDKQGGEGDLSKELNDLAKKQEQAGKDSHDLSEKADKGESKDQLAQQQAEAAKKQQDLRNQTEKAKKNAGQQSQSAQSPEEKDALKQAQDKLDKAQQAQQKAEEKLKEGDTKGAEQQQQDAAKQLQQAAKDAQGAQEAKEKQEQQMQQAQQQEGQQEPGDASKPFDATAAQILDQERKNKQAVQRFQRQRARPARVVKDW